eukprot:6189177-Pleurochrysis_carterae.AAC.1
MPAQPTVVDAQSPNLANEDHQTIAGTSLTPSLDAAPPPLHDAADIPALDAQTVLMMHSLALYTHTCLMLSLMMGPSSCCDETRSRTSTSVLYGHSHERKGVRRGASIAFVATRRWASAGEAGGGGASQGSPSWSERHPCRDWVRSPHQAAVYSCDAASIGGASRVAIGRKQGDETDLEQVTRPRVTAEARARCRFCSDEYCRKDTASSRLCSLTDAGVAFDTHKTSSGYEIRVESSGQILHLLLRRSRGEELMENGFCGA